MAVNIDDKLSVLYSSVGYGKLGTGEELGYDDGFLNPPFQCSTISAHARSMVVVKVNKPMWVYGYINGNTDSLKPVSCEVDGSVYGIIKRAGSYSESAFLNPGLHRLAFKCDDPVHNAHSVWGFRDEPARPFSDGESVELIVNSKCPRSCPVCNQDAFMKSQPDYEYTPDDARAFIGVLEKYGIKVNLIISGGEPMVCRNMTEVINILRSSQNIMSIAVTTSQDNEKHILNMKSLFDLVFLSHRPDMKWGNRNRPEWLKGVEVWRADYHSIWPTEKWIGKIHCCCRDVGDRASIIGQKVQPCATGESMRLMGIWPELELIGLDDYFSGRKTFGMIGTYDACRWCVNNKNYRNVAKCVSTEQKR
jgi:hypothetical protein